MVGSFVAFWPLYMSWSVIRIIALAFLIGVALSKAFNLFSSLHGVERFSIGEVSFALAVGLLTFLTKSDWIYAAALLQMGLADGLAGLLGVHLGKNNRYKVFGHSKSIAGTTTFLITSLAILFVGNALGHGMISWYFLVTISLVATLVENVAVWGLDNLFLPIITALLIMLARP